MEQMEYIPNMYSLCPTNRVISTSREVKHLQLENINIYAA
jgi:hypothetical protein